eukprot:scpid95490/ scgid22157/ 
MLPVQPSSHSEEPLQRRTALDFSSWVAKASLLEVDLCSVFSIHLHKEHHWADEAERHLFLGLYHLFQLDLPWLVTTTYTHTSSKHDELNPWILKSVRSQI